MFENLRRMRERIREYFEKHFGTRKMDSDEGLDFLGTESPHERIARIYKVQQENNKKLKEMNEKISNTIRRIEEVKKKMVNAPINETEKFFLKEKTNEQAREMLKNRPLPKLPFREFSEFVDLHEFIKFNKMGAITDKEVASCDWQETLRRLCE